MINSTASDKARVTFLQWLSVHDPVLFRRTVAKNFNAPRLGELGFIPALINAVIQVGSAVLQKKQADQQVSIQKKTIAAQNAQLDKDRAAQLQVALLDINTKRAQAGLGPVDINGNPIQSAALPMPSALKSTADALGVSYSNLAPWLIGGGVALLGVFVVTRGK